jgi:hypothetical protein
MAYMRGDFYLWTDSSDLHIWSASGYDGWDKASWNLQDDGEVKPSHKRNGQTMACGVCIPQEVADEYVVMRLAQMVKDGLVEAAIDRAVDPVGRGDSFGSRILVRYADSLKKALTETRSDVESDAVGATASR